MRSGDREQRMQHMLDPHDRHAAVANAPDQRDEVLALIVGQAAGDLVEKQQFGAGGKRARQFQPLAVEQRQRARPSDWPCPTIRSPEGSCEHRS